MISTPLRPRTRPVRAVLSPLASAILWIGCDGSLITIPVEQRAETTVAAGTILEDLLGDMGFSDFLAMDIVQSEELQNQGVAPGDVQDVRLVALSLEAKSPGGSDLSFLSSVEFWVEAPDLPRARVASAIAFPEGQAHVAFTIDDLDLTDYATSQSMTLTTEVTGHRPDEDTLVEAVIELDVGVTAQGACRAAEGS